MNLIDSAIQKKYNETSNEKIKKQTWDNFRQNVLDKHMYVYGAGSGLNYLFEYYPCGVNADGIIDEKFSNISLKMGDIKPEFSYTSYDLDLYCLDDFDNVDTDTVCFLITSTKYYEDIIQTLKDKGFSNYYVLLFLEINNSNRKMHGQPEYYSWQADKELFRTYCLEQKICKKKIVISYGDFGTHGKYITKQLLKLDNCLDIVWLVNDLKMTAPSGVRLVSIHNWKRYIYEMETAQMWLFDVMVPNYITKREGQIYIQLKHWSSITLKTFYLQDKPLLKAYPGLVEEVNNNAEMMDYVFVGSDFDVQTCETGFNVHHGFEYIGSARTDILFDTSMRKTIKEKLGIDDKKRIVLFCPTYRNSEQREGKNVLIRFDCERLKQSLKEKFEGEWLVLLRLHPHLAKQGRELAEQHEMIDVSQYEDSQELVAISDIVITDYSSIMFEPAFIRMPVFLFAPDREEFINNERDLLLEYDSLPFPICTNEAELTSAIQEFDYSEYVHNVDVFMNKYGVIEDGHASERAASFIWNLLDE